jgi:hypothetical protein
MGEDPEYLLLLLEPEKSSAVDGIWGGHKFDSFVARRRWKPQTILYFS